jgi:hypothetical protein
MINPISYNYNNTIYPYVKVDYHSNAPEPIGKINAINRIDDKKATSSGKVMPSECQTCKNRIYVDQSEDSNVSFKAPAHISPGASFSMVSAHEQEHVANAVSEGNKKDSQLVSTSVRLKMSVCPECGTPYISGGVTQTQIRYNNISNPYEKARKSTEANLLKGRNVNLLA